MDWNRIIVSSIAGLVVGIPVCVGLTLLLERLFPFRPK